MKFTIRFVLPLLLFEVLAIFSLLLSGQENSPHPRSYRLVEIGTFGGPWSGYNAGPIVNRKGTVVGAADTDSLDPYFPNCFNDCFVTHAWKWHGGKLVDLGALPNGFSSWTNAINSQGLVVGQSQNGEIDPDTGVPSFVPTVWKGGSAIDLGTFGGSFGIAAQVNDQGVVVGCAENGIQDPTGFAAAVNLVGTTELHAFRWTGGALKDLGTLGGPGAFALDINDSNQVIGFSLVDSTPGPTGLPTIAPFLWDSIHGMRNLGTLGGTLGSAVDINRLGQITGTSDLAGDFTAHPFLWQNGKMKDLGTLGGSFATANWLNDAGEVIGWSFTSNDALQHAFVWKRGRMIDLGTVQGDISSNAFWINNRGQIVGQSWFWDGQQVTASHAFLWEQGGPMVDLNTLVANPSDLYLTEANYITEEGMIVANGLLPNGDGRAAILIPQSDLAASTTASTPSYNSAIRQHRPFTTEMTERMKMQLGKSSRWIQLDRFRRQ
jgi:probable HAF family extracellular repeat protein